MARKTMRLRWWLLMQVAIGVAGPTVGRLVWSSSRSMWSGYGAVWLVPATAVVVAVATPRVREVHRRGESVHGILLRRRERARALVDSAGQLRVQAPLAAALFALSSLPVAFLALVAAPRAGGVDLPPTADARLQLYCIAAGAVLVVVGVDCWFGPGISIRGLATDGFTAAIVGFTIALAAAPSLMVFHRVNSRAAWLSVAAAQFVWSFGALFLAGSMSQRRKKRLQGLADAALEPSSRRSDGLGIDARYDLILQSPGDRKIPVTMNIRTVTALGLKEAKDLVDNAPGVVLHHVTGDQAERARTLLESLGATLTVSTVSTVGSEGAEP